MAGGKETPRQKMIGMMYLVLTALLALNVSKEIINAFVTLNNKIEVQNHTFEQGNSTVKDRIEGSIIMAKNEMGWNDVSFDEARERAQKEKVGKLVKLYSLLDLADSTHSETKAAVAQLMTYADAILQEGGAGEWLTEDDFGYMKIVDLNDEEKAYGSKDNYDIPTYHMVEQGKGEQMLEEIYSFRNAMAKKVMAVPIDGNKLDFELPEITKKSHGDTTYLEPLVTAFNEAVPDANGKELARLDRLKEIYTILTFPETVMNHGEEVTWVAGQFDHSPIAAATAIFTSIKGQMLQVESEVMKFIESQNDTPPFKFDTIEPKPFASTAYINQGDSLNLQVLIAAYDSKSQPKIRYQFAESDSADPDPEAWVMVENDMNQIILGRGEQGSSVADHYVIGEIEVEKDGKKTWRPWNFRYTVGAPQAAIANWETNILYAGYDNKVVASGGGADPNTLTLTGASTSATTFDGGQKGYIVKVSPGQRTVTLTLQGKDQTGKSVTLGSQTFRVERLPDPLPFLADVDPSNGTIQKGQLRGGRIIPKLVGSPLNVSFSVKDFVMEVSVGGRTKSMRGNGPNITPEMYNTIKGLSPGANIAIRNTRVIGPAGVRICPSVSYKLK